MYINLDTNCRIASTPHEREKIETNEPFQLNWLRSNSYFMEQLRREKCRSDRSKAPLSIALIWFKNHKRGYFYNLKGGLELIQKSTRETNIISYLGGGIIGIILPETNEKGIQEFKKRIVDKHENIFLSIITATYPNQIFNDLLTEKKTPHLTNLIERNLEGNDQMKLEKSLHMTRSQQVNLFSKYYFLEQLRREKRRSDRSKAPLSIAFIWLENHKRDNHIHLKRVLELTQNSIRETDIPGYLGEGVIGIILPDTDKKRTQEFKKRLIDKHQDLAFSITTAIYPDQIFNDLLTEKQDWPAFDNFFLYDSIEPNQFQYFLKRGVDILGSLVGIFLFSPLMLFTALAIKLNSPGPVVFKQIRLGKKGVPYVFYKFRSMYCNMDDRIHREYIAHLIQGNLEEINQGDKEKPLYKIKSDPRVTRVGKIIRKTSIDELPQLFNVLKGEMSLVGPRPPLPYEVEKYQPWHLRRVLEVKPGITGLWQVDGRSVSSFDDMVRFDIRYIVNWSLMLDVKILIKTVKAVLHSSGAV